MLEYNIAQLLLFMITISLYPVLSLCYGDQALQRTQPIILTILVGWLINRYCDDNNACCQIDVLTVHLIVWQIIYLMCEWGDFRLEYPFLFLHQASSCISTCINAFLLHDFVLRYLPFQLKISWLWMLSFYDM
jgi:hypothetical protein